MKVVMSPKLCKIVTLLLQTTSAALRGGGGSRGAAAPGPAVLGTAIGGSGKFYVLL